MNDRIHVEGLVTPVEVVRRRKFHTVAPAVFVRKMMQIYSCKGENAQSQENLTWFLVDIFWAGWVAEIRHERARRRKGGAAA